jgi:hypothetical protein
MTLCAIDQKPIDGYPVRVRTAEGVLVWVHSKCARAARLPATQCTADFYLNCGCCAEIQEFGCDRERGHEGKHSETVNNSVWNYRFEWEEVPDESDVGPGDVPADASG